jgi:hypothetical protein
MKKYLILVGVGLAAFLAGKYLTTPRVEVKEVVKVVEVEKKQQKKDKVVKSTKVKKPDGTVVTETTVTEQTQTNTDRTAQTEATKVTKTGPKITVGVLAVKNVDRFSEPMEFAATVTVPVFGNVKAQALGTTDKKVGLGVALEF